MIKIKLIEILQLSEKREPKPPDNQLWMRAAARDHGTQRLLTPAPPSHPLSRRVAGFGNLPAVPGLQHAARRPAHARPPAAGGAAGAAGLLPEHPLGAAAEPLRHRHGRCRLPHPWQYGHMDAHLLVHAECAAHMLRPHPRLPHRGSPLNAALLVGPGK